ncbi:MAG: hypothetical protein KDD94_07925 [Calditrichaeota bacterium]|nr:hypothetical protein [Calditrichota bacterium]
MSLRFRILVLLFLNLHPGFSQASAQTKTDYIRFHKIDQAWKYSQGEGVTIAVMDWLFDTSPPALNKYVDTVSMVPGQPVGSDEPWHGEWMAEIIHRIAPKAQIIAIRTQPGIRPEKNATIQPYDDYLIKGIRYAADHGAAAVTNSMGPVKMRQELLDAIAYAEKKGTVFINVHPEYLDLSNGRYTWCDNCDKRIIHSGIVSVPDHPIDPSKDRDIYTWPYQIDPVFKDGWGFSNGPPIVAGVVALIKSIRPQLTTAQLKQILLKTSRLESGFRILDAKAALFYLKR